MKPCILEATVLAALLLSAAASPMASAATPRPTIGDTGLVAAQSPQALGMDSSGFSAKVVAKSTRRWTKRASPSRTLANSAQAQGGCCAHASAMLGNRFATGAPKSWGK